MKIKDPQACPANYNELHSIERLTNLAISNYSDSLLVCEIFCNYGIVYNLNKLTECDLFSSASSKKRLQWIYDLTELANKINTAKTVSVKSLSVFIYEANYISKEYNSASIYFDNFLTNIISDEFIESSDSQMVECLHWIKLVLESLSSYRLIAHYKGNETLNNLPIKALLFDSNIIDADFVFEFRLMHQMQEVLFMGINKLLEDVIHLLYKNKLDKIIKIQVEILQLFFIVFEVLEKLKRLLNINEYHSFRLLLGESSGIQSNVICTTCFKKLYPYYSKKIREIVIKSQDISLLGECEKYIIQQAFSISKSIHHWKKMHLFFPKYYLGGSYNGVGTGSMIGIKDGLKAVENMLLSGIKNDELFDLYNQHSENNDISFKASDLISKKTAKLTQNKFKNIQAKAIRANS